jgi:DNA-binding LytR/AlgR family response regulator
LVPAILFLAIAFIATEAEQLIRGLVFQEQEYQMLSAGKLYLFNGIITLVLGLSFFQYKSLTGQDSAADTQILDQENSDPISKIPVKKGEVVSFIALQQIVYFEAFDNYSFVHTLDGEKKLCDYSLLFLETRLNEDFSRIHRKYIVNKSHIRQIKPHLNGRHILEFGNKIEPITSSKSYSTTIQGLIKIK